jgi:hypothetical protein
METSKIGTAALSRIGPLPPKRSHTLACSDGVGTGRLHIAALSRQRKPAERHGAPAKFACQYIQFGFW